MIYVIAPVSPAVASDLTAADRQEAYEANLAACLDGELPAFCDKTKLSTEDAARVQRAEIEANLVACMDPERYKRCRPELLPTVLELPAQAPEYRPAPTRIFGRSTPAAAAARTPATVAARSPPTAIAASADELTDEQLELPTRPILIEPAAAAAPSKPAEPTPVSRVQKAGLSTPAIAARMISASIAAYPGTCACPYNRDRAGRRCGGRSAYVRAGGYGPICYARDVTPAMIEEFPARQG